MKKKKKQREELNRMLTALERAIREEEFQRELLRNELNSAYPLEKSIKEYEENIADAKKKQTWMLNRITRIREGTGI